MTPSPQPVIHVAADTLDLHTAASFCQLHYQTLRERAKNGEIPGACKPGKKWVFLRTGLVQYLESLSPCHSTKLAASIMLTSRPRTGNGIGHLLTLPTKQKRKRSTNNSGASYGDRTS